MIEWYEILIPIASLITAVVALISVHFLKNQSKMTENAYHTSKKVSEVETFLKIEQNILFDETMKKVRLKIASTEPVLKMDGGSVEHVDFITYLETINRLVYFSRMGIIHESNLVNAFGSTAVEIEGNPYVVKYIKQIQDKQGKNILSGIHTMAELRRKNYSKVS